MARRPLVAGNWKMYKTVEETRRYIDQLVALLDGELGGPNLPELALCVPFTSLAAAVERVGGRPIAVFAQNMHHEPEGPYTGEVSAPMLLECGCSGVVLGHSERRTYFGETDRALALKVPAALAAGLTPILCVGESEAQREAGETERTLRHQVGEALSGVADDQLERVVIAYEPVWAIGTGKRATAEQIEEAAFFIRALVEARSHRAAERLRILYGGSVSEDNAAELFELQNVDGALVGGASLDPQRFAAIARSARG